MFVNILTVLTIACSGLKILFSVSAYFILTFRFLSSYSVLHLSTCLPQFCLHALALSNHVNCFSRTLSPHPFSVLLSCHFFRFSSSVFSSQAANYIVIIFMHWYRMKTGRKHRSHLVFAVSRFMFVIQRMGILTDVFMVLLSPSCQIPGQYSKCGATASFHVLPHVSSPCT
jgi:hypothetical protein